MIGDVDTLKCTHFKVEGQWFFVALSIRKEFMKAFTVTEMLKLHPGRRGSAVGSVMIYPYPVKLYTHLDLYEYMVNKNSLVKAEVFTTEQIKKLRADLLVRQVKK